MTLFNEMQQIVKLDKGIDKKRCFNELLASWPNFKMEMNIEQQLREIILNPNKDSVRELEDILPLETLVLGTSGRILVPVSVYEVDTKPWNIQIPSLALMAMFTLMPVVSYLLGYLPWASVWGVTKLMLVIGSLVTFFVWFMLKWSQDMMTWERKRFISTCLARARWMDAQIESHKT